MKTMKGPHKFRERDSQQERREDLSWAWGTEKPRVGVVLAKRMWSVSVAETISHWACGIFRMSSTTL